MDKSLSWEEIDIELNKFSKRMDIVTNKLYEIYRQPLFTKDSMFYRQLQVYWIREFKDININGK